LGVGICPSFSANHSRDIGLAKNMVVSSPTIFRAWREHMSKEITLAKLRTMADRSGLQLTDEDLEKLLPGVNRSYNQILELRGLITDRTEPAAAFVASRTEKNR
jgi:hypothetical protein